MALQQQPIEAAVSPLPSEQTTPPVTKMYFTGLDGVGLEEGALGLGMIVNGPGRRDGR